MKSSRAAPLFITGCLLAITVWATTEFLLERSNSLHLNGHWAGTKTTLQRSVMGSVSFMATRRALMYNQLDLSTWFGFQEVIFKKKVTPQSISFDFSLDPNAYLVFLFDKTDQGASGIRLSRSKDFPGLFFKVDPEGKFLSREELPGLTVLPSNHAVAVFSKDRIDFVVNEIWKYAHSRNQEGESRFGFRGGYFPSYLKKVEIKSSDLNYLETFHNTRHYFLVALSVLIFSLLFTYVFSRKARLFKSSEWSAVYFAGFLCILSLSALGVDYQYLASRYPEWKDINTYDYDLTTVEAAENTLKRVRSEAELIKPKSPIVFLGSSQTWGSGVYRLEDIFAKRIQRYLDRDFGPDVFPVIDLGLCGYNSIDIQKYYSTEWFQFHPRLVVINLSSNDTANPPEVYKKNIEAIVKLNESMKIPTLISLEGNSIEKPYEGLVERHQILREIAKEHHLQVVDTYSILSSQHDTGFIWWDVVHMTSYGNLLAAEALYPAIKKAVNP